MSMPNQPNRHSLRDNQGRWAPVSSPNGGGASFGQPGGEGIPNGGGEPSFPDAKDADWGSTSDALFRGKDLPRPNSAPSMTGGTFEPAEPFDAHAALSAVSLDQGEGLGAAGDHLRDGMDQLRPSGEQAEGDHFEPALRAMGHGPEEGPVRPDLAEHLSSQVPPANPAVPSHPFPRSTYHALANGDGGPDFGGAEPANV